MQKYFSKFFLYFSTFSLKGWKRRRRKEFKEFDKSKTQVLEAQIKAFWRQNTISWHLNLSKQKKMTIDYILQETNWLPRWFAGKILNFTYIYIPIKKESLIVKLWEYWKGFKQTLSHTCSTDKYTFDNAKFKKVLTIDTSLQVSFKKWQNS